MAKVNIVISGRTGSGRYCVAHLVQHALKKAGLDVEIEGVDEEEPKLLQMEWEKRIRNLAGQGTLKVGLVTKYARPRPKPLTGYNPT